MKKLVYESLNEYLLEQVEPVTKNKIDIIQLYQDLYNRTEDDHAFTPFYLCKELIQDAIDAGADINTDKILVTHSPEIIKTLKSDFNLSKDSIFNRVHFFTTCSYKAAFAKMQGVDPRNILLNEGYKYKTNKFMNQYDLIIGNPPFEAGKGARNIKLWYNFSKMTINSFPKIIAYITPNSVISDKGENGKDLRNYIKNNRYGFIHVRNHTENPFKDKGVETCHWIIKRFTGDQVDPVIIKRGDLNHNIRETIIDKVINSGDQRLPLESQNGHVKRSETRGGLYEIHYSGPSISKTSKDLEGNGIKKIVFPFSSSYHKIFYTTKPVGMLNLFMPVNSEEEYEQIKNYALHPLLRYVAKFYRKTSGFTPFVKNNQIPDLRFKKNWTSDEIYQHFGVTSKEEIEEINKEIKN